MIFRNQQYMSCHKLQTCTDFSHVDFQFRIAPVRYQGQTGDTRILDCKPSHRYILSLWTQIGVEIFFLRTLFVQVINLKPRFDSEDADLFLCVIFTRRPMRDWGLGEAMSAALVCIILLRSRPSATAADSETASVCARPSNSLKLCQWSAPELCHWSNPTIVFWNRLREWLPGNRQGLKPELKLEICCVRNEL